VHVVRAEGVWLVDADGRRLLDAYNNVPVVGHCHPRVTEAVVRQTRAVNTHARYLYEPLVELAERLAGSMPPGSGLDTVMLVNSGSEANDLAWRIATANTGRTGGIVTAHAYHGVSTAIADLSPEEWVGDLRPPTVRTIDLRQPADIEIARALDGFELAATYLDAGLTSDGILTPPASELREVVRATHEAGGLFVADEVQVGHGRSGAHLWAFAHFGLAPDIVTLGKPMGNGYPVAAVIARHELVDAFAETTDFFSTFGGNPVAARAALAVLDVIEDEGLIEHAGHVGSRLTDELRRLEHPAVAGVRGLGLLVGVELVEPDLARRVVDRLRDNGILIGRTGPGETVLKIRPPLVFGSEHADLLVQNLEASLAAEGG
jgi:4-aminobutyrate aminotransferase-like enzyme